MDFLHSNSGAMYALGLGVIVLLALLWMVIKKRRRQSRKLSSSRSSRKEPSTTPPMSPKPVLPPEVYPYAAKADAGEDSAQPTLPAPGGATTTTEIALVPQTSAADPEFEVQPEGEKKSLLIARLIIEESSTLPGRVEAFRIQAKVRLARADRGHRVIREVTLNVRSPDGMDHPVYSTNPDWQRSPNRKDFYFIGETYRPDDGEKDSADWIDVLHVPVNLLELPRTGRNELRALVTWRSRRSKLVVARATGACTFEVSGSGYLDTQEEQDLPDWSIARVLGMILYLNGEPAPAALAEVEKEFEARIPAGVKNDRLKQHQNSRLKQVIAETGKLPNAERENAAKEACRKLTKLVRGAERMKLQDFFLRVAAAGSPTVGAGAPLGERLARWLHVRTDSEAEPAPTAAAPELPES